MWRISFRFEFICLANEFKSFTLLQLSKTVTNSWSSENILGTPCQWETEQVVTRASQRRRLWILPWTSTTLYLWWEWSHSMCDRKQPRSLCEEILHLGQRSHPTICKEGILSTVRFQHHVTLLMCGRNWACFYGRPSILQWLVQEETNLSEPGWKNSLNMTPLRI